MPVCTGASLWGSVSQLDKKRWLAHDNLTRERNEPTGSCQVVAHVWGWNSINRRCMMPLPFAPLCWRMRRINGSEEAWYEGSAGWSLSILQPEHTTIYVCSDQQTCFASRQTRARTHTRLRHLHTRARATHTHTHIVSKVCPVCGRQLGGSRRKTVYDVPPTFVCRTLQSCLDMFLDSNLDVLSIYWWESSFYHCLCDRHRLAAPVAKNTIARIGPVEIDVPLAEFSHHGNESNCSRWSL